jgi:hypothetical protein
MVTFVNSVHKDEGKYFTDIEEAIKTHGNSLKELEVECAAAKKTKPFERTGGEKELIRLIPRVREGSSILIVMQVFSRAKGYANALENIVSELKTKILKLKTKWDTPGAPGVAVHGAAEGSSDAVVGETVEGSSDAVVSGAIGGLSDVPVNEEPSLNYTNSEDILNSTVSSMSDMISRDVADILILKEACGEIWKKFESDYLHVSDVLRGIKHVKDDDDYKNLDGVFKNYFKEDAIAKLELMFRDCLCAKIEETGKEVSLESIVNGVYERFKSILDAPLTFLKKCERKKLDTKEQIIGETQSRLKQLHSNLNKSYNTFFQLQFLEQYERCIEDGTFR